MNRPALGRPWTRMVATVIEEEPECQLHYPDICTGQSETADHKTPRAHGGPDTRDNLQGACHPCNKHRKDNPLPTTDQDKWSRQWI